jgi:hypothetical protein
MNEFLLIQRLTRKLGVFTIKTGFYQLLAKVRTRDYFRCKEITNTVVVVSRYFDFIGIRTAIHRYGTDRTVAFIK